MADADISCGPNADDRYCPRFWELTAENTRLRELIDELLDCTGLDDDEKREYLDRAGIEEEAAES